MNKGGNNQRPTSEPSAAEIKERCAEIQAEWTPYVEARRRGKPRLTQIGTVKLWAEVVDD